VSEQVDQPVDLLLARPCPTARPRISWTRPRTVPLRRPARGRRPRRGRGAGVPAYGGGGGSAGIRPFGPTPAQCAAPSPPPTTRCRAG